MSSDYAKMMNRHQAELNAFPIKFAFNKKQADDMLQEFGVGPEDLLGLGGGGYIKKSDENAFDAMSKRVEKELTEAMKSDEFMLGALKYELGNHEYAATYDRGPALDALNLSLKDERVARLCEEACNWVLENTVGWSNEKSFDAKKADRRKWRKKGTTRRVQRDVSRYL